MPRNNPTPEDLQRGASELVETVTTLLRNLGRAQFELIEAAIRVGLTWDEIASLTGYPTGDAARMAHGRRDAGQP